MRIVKGLRENFFGCKFFRIRRSAMRADVQKTKGLQKGNRNDPGLQPIDLKRAAWQESVLLFEGSRRFTSFLTGTSYEDGIHRAGSVERIGFEQSFGLPAFDCAGFGRGAGGVG